MLQWLHYAFSLYTRKTTYTKL